MIDISRKKHERNGVETIVDSDRMFCLNEKHIGEELDHWNLWVTTIKYRSGYRKHRYKLVNESKKPRNIVFICKELTTKVIMGCRRTAGHKCKTRLGFKQYDVILTE